MRTLSTDDSMLVNAATRYGSAGDTTADAVMPSFRVLLRVIITQVSSGQQMTFTSQDGFDWLKDVDIRSTSEEPVGTAKITLRRSNWYSSLTPLNSGWYGKLGLGDAPSVAGSTEPTRHIGLRRLTVETQVRPMGYGAARTNNWVLMFDGYMDNPSYSLVDQDMVIECRDLGALLVDTFLQIGQTFGDGAKQLDVVMQDVIDAAIANQAGGISQWAAGHTYSAGDLVRPTTRNEYFYQASAGTSGGAEPTWGVIPSQSTTDNTVSWKCMGVLPTLHVDTGPGWVVNAYHQEPASLMEVLKRLANMIGWDCRYVYNAALASFVLQLLAPQRSASSTVLDIRNQIWFREIGPIHNPIDRVRTDIEVTYVDSADNITKTKTYPGSTPDYAANYGRRFMGLVEDATSNIRGATLTDGKIDAQELADSIGGDLGTPWREFDVDMMYWPPVELYDYMTIQWGENQAPTRRPQSLASVDQGGGGVASILASPLEIHHHLGPDGCFTRLHMRESTYGAVGMTLGWLGQEKRTGVGSAIPDKSDSRSFTTRVYVTTGQSVAANTVTTVVFDTENFDLGGNTSTAPYATATGTFTAPVTAMYSVHALVTLASVSVGVIGELHVYVNGADTSVFRQFVCTSAGDMAFETSAHTGILLSQGDALTIRIKHNDSASRNVKSGISGTTGQAYNSLAVKRVR